MQRPAAERALYVSSPIGLGHARRDVAIAELRRPPPDLEIDWLAQHPVTDVLRAHGERASGVGDAGQRVGARRGRGAEHDLHVFQAIRRMDEILVNNFIVFQDVVDDGTTTSSSATRRGTSTTSCTRTPSSSGSPSCG